MSQFVDSSVLLLAAGGDSPARTAARTLLDQERDSGEPLHASVEAIQEFVFHRMRRGDSRELAVAKGDQLSEALVLHDFDIAVLGRALELIATSPVGGRDAVHAATALLAGFTTIVSADRAFDGVPGLARVPITGG